MLLSIRSAYPPLFAFSISARSPSDLNLGGLYVLRALLSMLSPARCPSLALNRSPCPIFPATALLRRPISPNLLPSDAVGQSGCRHLIERVFREKGVPPHRGYLTTYALPNLICEIRLTLCLSPTQRWEAQVCIEGSLCGRLQVVVGPLPWPGRLDRVQDYAHVIQSTNSSRTLEKSFPGYDG